jgi:hypothetical protein
MLIKRWIRVPNHAKDYSFDEVSHSPMGLNNVFLIRIFNGTGEIKHRVIITMSDRNDDFPYLGLKEYVHVDNRKNPEDIGRLSFYFGEDDSEYFLINVPFDPTDYDTYFRLEKDEYEVIFVSRK